MADYYKREWLVALHAVLGRPLEVDDLKALFKVKRLAACLGGRTVVRVIFFVFGDQHHDMLVKCGIRETVRVRDDLLASSVLVPKSKFNEAATVDRITAQGKKIRHRASAKEFPRKRDHRSGSNGHVIEGRLLDTGRPVVFKFPKGMKPFGSGHRG